MRRASQFFLVIAITVPLWYEGNVAAQNQQASKDDNQLVVFLGSAAAGATIGGLSTGFFQVVSGWTSRCSGSASSQKFLEQYGDPLDWSKGMRFSRVVLGPAIGAVAGIIFVSQLYKLEGDLGFAFVGGLTGVSTGLVAGCGLLMVAHTPALEFLTMILPIGWAAVGAVIGYGPHSRSSSRPAQAEVSLSVNMKF